MGSVWAPTVASVPGDSTPLNVNINQCLRAEVGYISGRGNEGGGSRWPEIKTAGKTSADPPEWNPVWRSAKLSARGKETSASWQSAFPWATRGTGSVWFGLVGVSVSLGAGAFCTFHKTARLR